jgi:hypothetical protein
MLSARLTECARYGSVTHSGVFYQIPCPELTLELLHVPGLSKQEMNWGRSPGLARFHSDALALSFAGFVCD